MLFCFFNQYYAKLVFPGGSEVKAFACNAGDLGDPWVGKFPWRRKWQPTPVFLPGESHGQRNLVGYSPRGRKESGTTKRPYLLCINYQPMLKVRWLCLIMKTTYQKGIICILINFLFLGNLYSTHHYCIETLRLL